MAKRDPEKTARNKIIEDLTNQLKKIEDRVLKVTGFHNVHSLNAKLGGKHADFIDIQNEVIHSSDHFISLYLEGFKNFIDRGGYYITQSNQYETYQLLRKYPIFQEYFDLFMKRTYLRNIDSLSKKRPRVEDAEIWIGQENASYGILVTPRFVNGKWENDKSEIRHFKPRYWTVGHILATGLVIPNEEEKITFSNFDEYLNFFKNVIVRNSGSPYEREIAKRYCEYVKASEHPEHVPLLIPEFRYGGIEKKHKYRLDFTIIEPQELTKIGFEISPWSSHGYLSKTKKMTQKEINEIAKGNFEKEMKKHKDFFRRFGVIVLIYTDSDLLDMDSVFGDISRYLLPKNIGTQIKFHIMSDFLK